MIPAVCLAVILATAAIDQPGETDETALAVARARAWLAPQQDEDGSFRSHKSAAVPPVARTAMALWALSVTPRDLSSAAATDRAVAYLLDKQGDDGGIYDRGSGLRFATAAVVRQGLRAYHAAGGQGDELPAALDRLEQFLARGHSPESQNADRLAPPSEMLARRIEALRQDSELSPNVERALNFLQRLERGGGAVDTVPHLPRGLTYRQLLEMTGQDPSPDSDAVRNTVTFLREHYTLAENPDLTRRYGPDGFHQGDAGLYYYYLTLARTLGCTGARVLETTDGTVHHWPLELARHLVSLQRPDGSWRNDNGRWWEDDPVLVTAYALIALSVCEDLDGEAS